MMRLLLVIIGSLVSSAVMADSINYESGPVQTTMIELYTSEGCSSCPPAEAYLNSYAKNPLLWSHYIPVALHVDYWDYLGWKDVFAEKENSERQRKYARVNRAPTVFTPAFFVNGRNWRPGIFQKSPDTGTGNIGNLKVHIKNNNVSVSFKPVEKLSDHLTANIGILGFGLTTQITRGENAGRHSKHEFVLLGRTRLQHDSPMHWSGKIPKVNDVGAREFALIAWVSEPDSPRPIQATGGRLPLKNIVIQKK